MDKKKIIFIALVVLAAILGGVMVVLPKIKAKKAEEQAALEESMKVKNVITAFYPLDKTEIEVEPGTDEEHVIAMLQDTVIATIDGENTSLRITWRAVQYDPEHEGTYKFEVEVPSVYQIELPAQVPTMNVTVKAPEEKQTDPMEEISLPEEVATSDAEVEEPENGEVEVAESHKVVYLADARYSVFAENNADRAYFIVNPGNDIAWYMDTAVEEVRAVLEEGGSVVIMPGVASLEAGAEYAKMAAEMADALEEGQKVYVVTALQVEDMNADESIDAFNNDIYNNLREDIGFIDTFYTLSNTDIWLEADGVTFDEATSNVILDDIEIALAA